MSFTFWRCWSTLCACATAGIATGTTKVTARATGRPRRICFKEWRMVRSTTLANVTNVLRTADEHSYVASHTLIVHSHSMVPGGFDVMSYATRLMPGTSLMMRCDITSSTS